MIRRNYVCMKKLSLVLALLAMVGIVLVTGCKPAENKPAETPTAPAAPDTNAPAK